MSTIPTAASAHIFHQNMGSNTGLRNQTRTRRRTYMTEPASNVARSAFHARSWFFRAMRPIAMVTAVLESQRIDAAPYIAMSAIPTHHDLRASLQAYVVRLRQAWFVHGAGNVYARTLAAGLASVAVGPACVNSILEPLLQSVEQLLRAHIQRGELAPCDERFASLEFLSPLVLGLLHQDSLSGKSCRPLNLDAFVERHLDVFLAGHPAPAKARRARG